MGEDELDEEHVGNGIANGLVDELGAGLEGVKGDFLCWRLWFVLPDAFEGNVGE